MFDDFDAILCDLDGCLVSGSQLMPGARELVDLVADRLVILSNNSTDTPATLAQRLARMGLNVHPHRIVLAGVAALEQLVSDGEEVRLCLYGSQALHDHARLLGLQLDRAKPSHVLLTRDEAFRYRDLADCVRFLREGAQLVVANGDRSHPGPHASAPVPETGSLLAAILAVLPGQSHRVIGKPEASLYLRALARFPTVPHRVLAIGDNPETDGAGAARYGYECVIVGPQSASFPDIAAVLSTW